MTEPRHRPASDVDHRAEAERLLVAIQEHVDRVTDAAAPEDDLAMRTWVATLNVGMATAHALLALGDVMRPAGFTFVIPDPPGAEAERLQRIADDIADEHER